MNVLLSNEALQEVIQIAKSIAKENYNSKYSGAHILQALLHDSLDVYEFLDRMGMDPQYVYEWAEVRIEDYPKTTQQQMEIQADEHVQGLWEYAEEVRNKLGLQEITPLCLLLSLVKPYAAFRYVSIRFSFFRVRLLAQVSLAFCKCNSYGSRNARTEI